jgi:hypothetical protein
LVLVSFLVSCADAKTPVRSIAQKSIFFMCRILRCLISCN